MAEITLRQAARWCGGTVEDKYAEVSFFGANNDTRILKPGQLFIVLQGARDGHDFIPAAMEKGAAAVLCSRKVGDYPAIYVEDPRIALGQIAREALKELKAKVVAITGSVGKSTTKEMIAAVLASTYKVSKTPANHNNDIGMPMAILAMPADTEVAVLEMGMNHFREIAYLSNIAYPDVAVIVNIGTVHMEYLGSREGIRQAKMEITEGMSEKGLLLLNGDDAMLRNLDKQPVQRVNYFGTSEGCHIQGQNVLQEEGTLSFQAEAGKLSIPVKLPLEGEHFVPDALAAVAVGLKLMVAPEKITQALSEFRNISGRQETFQADGYTIINDCYNAAPESMEASLKVLGNKPGRRVAVLGDMLELGGASSAEHFKIGRIAAQKSDLLLVIGPHAGRVRDGALTGGMEPERVYTFEDRQELTGMLKSKAKAGDTILFKASHGIHLELVLAEFLKKEK